MTLTFQKQASVYGARLVVAGEMTYATLWPLRGELLSLTGQAPSNLTVDLCGVNYLDNDGLALLVLACKLLHGAARTLSLEATAGSQPDRLLRLRRLDTVIPLMSIPP